MWLTIALASAMAACGGGDTSPVQGCLADGDCPAGQTCLNGNCAAASTSTTDGGGSASTSGACESDLDCGPGERCIAGFCVGADPGDGDEEGPEEGGEEGDEEGAGEGPEGEEAAPPDGGEGIEGVPPTEGLEGTEGIEAGTEGPEGTPIACAVDCGLLPHGRGTCENGVCVGLVCDLGFSNDNGIPDDGCEALCAPTPPPHPPCDGKDNDCNGVVDDENVLDADPANCGYCGNACPPGVNAGPFCATGQCRIKCKPGFFDNDGIAANGCESQDCQVSDPPTEICDNRDNDCNGAIDDGFDKTLPGSCGETCTKCAAQAPNTEARCTAGACEYPCVAGFVDADKNPANGCELACVPATPATEVCDGKDNDCNGVIDDNATGCPAGQECVGGQCRKNCTEDCAQEGQVVCKDSKTLTSCGDYDTDPCLEFGNDTACGAGEFCQSGKCEKSCTSECNTPGEQVCADVARYVVCEDAGAGCLRYSTPKECKAGEVCDSTSNACVKECTPDCSAKECGSDGCGGSCGVCNSPNVCNAQGLCECKGVCTGKECGSDGCFGVCGTCKGSKAQCVNGKCQCTPDCSGVICGDDGCGGTCDNCGAGKVCDKATGQCCTRDCAHGGCDDGCGGTCPGVCTAGQVCTGTGATSVCCTPACAGKECGPDGCGGSCPDQCSSSEVCSGGQCVCQGTCSGKNCGSDGCGKSCGTCDPENYDVCYQGKCCKRDCALKCAGAPDGCGGTCPQNCENFFGGQFTCNQATKECECNAPSVQCKILGQLVQCCPQGKQCAIGIFPICSN